MNAAKLIRQYCKESGRSLEHQLPDGTWVPLDVEDLDVTFTLEEIRFSKNVAADASFLGGGVLKHDDAATKVKHRPGPDPEKQWAIQAKARELIAARECTIEELLGAHRMIWESLFPGRSHITVERALKQLLA